MMQQVLTPPSAESIRAIRELVAAAVGLVPARGDQLVIESLPFESTLQAAPPPLPGPMPAEPPAAAPTSGLALPHWDWRIWAGLAGGLVVLLAGGVAVNRMRKLRRKRVELQRARELAGQPPPASLAAGTPEATQIADTPAVKALAQAQERVTQTARIETLVEELRKSVAEDPALAARVLRSWLEEIEA